MKFLGEERRGSAAANTWARNRGGQYMRARNGRGGPGWAYLATVVNTWQTVLTDAQRHSYYQRAALYSRTDSLGQKYTLNGYNLYIAEALAGFYAAFPIGPAKLQMGPAASTISYAAGPTLTASTVHGANVSVDWQSSGVVTPSTYSAPGRGKWWKIIGNDGWPAAGTNTTNLTAGFVAAFGALPAVGEYIWVRWRVFSAGHWTEFGRQRLQR